MNKLTKKIVSVITACALAVGVMSGTGTITKAATVATTLVPPVVVDPTSTPEMATATVSLPGAAGNSMATADSLAQVVQIPVANRGVLRVDYVTTGASGNIDVTLYSDAACTMKVGYAGYISSGLPSGSQYFTITAAGEYYLKFNWSYSVPETATNIVVGARAFNGEEVTLNDSYQMIYTDDSTITNYHKLVVNSDSLVTLSGYAVSDYDGSTLSLGYNITDGSKISLATGYLSSSNNYCVSYALKKGTYYVASSEGDPYVLKAAIAKVKDKSGKSKGKAKLLKKKKGISGMITLTDGTGKANWFKIKLPKRSKVKIQYTARCTDSLKVEVIPANKRSIMYNSTTYMKSGKSGFRSDGKWSAGTYYIKVSKSYGEYSGSYTLKRIK